MSLKVIKPALNEVFYKVIKGDSYEIVSEKLFVVKSFLEKHNPDFIFTPNNILYLPYCGSDEYIVKPNERLCDIALKFNISEEYIKDINQIVNVFAGIKIFI